MSELKTNKIQTNDTNNVAIDNSLKLKGYTTTQRDALSSPEAGDVVYNSTTGTIDFYNGTAWNATSDNTFQFNVEYLVIAGGGSGGHSYGQNVSRGTSGGGAGGYRTNYASETSGGGGSNESDFTATGGTNYTVTIGAGGAAVSSGLGNPGNNSVFDTIISIAGGYGGRANVKGGDGGSGGGSGYNQSATKGTANQGYAGGYGWTDGGNFGGGGGGGAGGAGANAAQNNPGNGGVGVQSSITGLATYRAGGGAGAQSGYTNYNYQGSGGNGGGGAATQSGTANTGGGGGGARTTTSGAGGSGVVILRYPATKTISNPGGGLTISSETSAGGFKYVEITAGTGNVSWS